MPHQLKVFAVVASLFACPLLAALIAPAHADERCSGTLCDFYYGNSPADPAKPAAKPAAPTATPIMVPKNGILGYFSSGGSAQTPSDASGTTAAGPTSRMHVGGGGILGLARGETPERCSGTICDLYYGGPPPEKPEAPANGTAVAAQPAPDAAPSAADEAQEATRPTRRERVEFVEIQREQKPRCAPTAQDPWRCYR